MRAGAAAALALVVLGGCARDAYTDQRLQIMGCEARGDDLVVYFYAIETTSVPTWCPGADVHRAKDGARELTFIRAPVGQRPPVDLPAQQLGGRVGVVVPHGGHGVVSVADGPVISNRP